jgi:hypothetical protein
MERSSVEMPEATFDAGNAFAGRRDRIVGAQPLGGDLEVFPSRSPCGLGELRELPVPRRYGLAASPRYFPKDHRHDDCGGFKDSGNLNRAAQRDAMFA